MVVETNADETHREMLGCELTHRIKNSLAVVSAIARLSLRSCGRQDLDGFLGRLAALPLAQDMLLSHQWEYGELGQIVRQTIAALGMKERIDVHGDYVAFNPNSVFAYTLTIHELVTNAIKHGALSVPGGRVGVTWSAVGDARDRIHFIWRERGGPPVKPPEHSGFRATLLGKLLAADLGNSQVQLDFHPDGLCRDRRSHAKILGGDDRMIGQPHLAFKRCCWPGADICRPGRSRTRLGASYKLED